MIFTRALNYLQELQVAVLTTCDGMAMEDVTKALAVIFKPIAAIQKDSTSETSMLKRALRKLVEETGVEKHPINDVLARMKQGGL